MQPAWQLSGQFEGDIILTPRAKSRNNRNKIWPNRTVPYMFRDGGKYTKKQKRLIKSALKQFQKKTCITVRSYKPGDRDYIAITANDDGCYSSVGREGGEQQTNLQPHVIGKGCMRQGSIIHEFLHILGFLHEHGDPNRDSYIQIRTENIDREATINFVKYSPEVYNDFGAGYDYRSLMHYNAFAFTNNSKKTIIAPNYIGQRAGFSTKDIIKLNRMYGCDSNWSPRN
ncbi:seminal metalloprotease 1-like [Chrysoperla carnea]|uniref:seminal metalloprotease 1-like n=1 Tax=Chrysoperla carnea TaxID=189513 RepID=UPI001D091BA8|nr:seminal metalloprotease 1-like [Chrysoperla carnea]